MEEYIGSYRRIGDRTFFFEGCRICDAQCCDGRKGYMLTPLILDDFVEVYKNFAIVFGKIEDSFRPLMVLNDGRSPCRYLQEGRCGIYQMRPPACKTYPVSPYFDEIYVDTACPAITQTPTSVPIVRSGSVDRDFYHNRFENFSKKLMRTRRYIASLLEKTPNFEPFSSLGGVRLFRYRGNVKDRYVTMHLESLRYFESGT